LAEQPRAEPAVTPAEKKSFRDLPPLDQGGVEARQGFALQDHVAARACLHMLRTPGVLEVWCETHDDIVVVSVRAGVEEFEFIQIKGTEPDQLWTVAVLCKREGKKSSVLERSLANDRGKEPPRFRLITSRQVGHALEPLTYPVGSDQRAHARDKLAMLCTELGKALGDIRSPNGNGHDFWVDRTEWEDGLRLEFVETRNLNTLRSLFDDLNELAAPDRIQEIYARLLRKVYDAGLSRSSSEKRLVRHELAAWLNDAIAELTQRQTGGVALRGKMQKANLDPESITNALLQRRVYVKELLRQDYMTVRDFEQLEAGVSREMQRLRMQLDSGQLNTDGREFHRMCVETVHRLEARLPVSAGNLFAQGCMYDLADRCAHRFTRAEP
jgi:hypothetical protein